MDSFYSEKREDLCVCMIRCEINEFYLDQSVREIACM